MIVLLNIVVLTIGLVVVCTLHVNLRFLRIYNYLPMF